MASETKALTANEVVSALMLWREEEIRWIRSAPDPEDIYSEAILAIYERVACPSSGVRFSLPGELRNYLRRVIQTMARNEQTRIRNVGGFQFEEDWGDSSCTSGQDTDPAGVAEHRDSIAAMTDALNRLPAERSRFLRECHSGPQSEVAHRWKLHPSTVSRRREQILRDVRSLMRDRGGRVH